MMSRILAIDPGFGRVGIAVLEGTGSHPIYVYSSCFTTDKNTPFEKRLLLIQEELASVIEKWSPTSAALETLLFSKNQKTVMGVAEARGAILGEVARAGIPLFEYNPLQVKLAVTGHGKADKKEVAKMIPRLVSLPKTVSSDDEMDAIAIGITALAFSRNVIHKK